MATYLYTDLRIPEAQLYADLNGILIDLQRAGDFAQRLLAQLTATPPDYTLAEPFSIAIVISYARAFSSGVRHHLHDDDLNVLTPDQLAAHRYLLAIRNKHIAHSVNEYEDNHAVVNYCLERVHDEGIASVSFQGNRLVSLGGHELGYVISITRDLETYLRGRTQSEERRLLDIVRKMPVEAVLGGGRDEFQPSKGRVDKRRPRT